jgi:glycosyltransferase involved in cell wall biosynthesis
VRQSFLKEYPVYVIHNGINLDVFRPVSSSFREKYGLENKKLVLGVSYGWDARKGLDVFIELSKKLPYNYQIVLVGTDSNVDKLLPENILSIHRTQNQRELAEIYTSADVFTNPTREEVLGLVNIEALACGTPGITFSSGGSPECYDDTCGSVVACDDVDALEKEILRICTDKPYPEAACLGKAREFDQSERIKEYLKLYERVISTGN